MAPVCTTILPFTLTRVLIGFGFPASHFATAARASLHWYPCRIRSTMPCASCKFLAGIVASIVLAVGGVAVGAWGFQRRDLRG